MMQLDIDADEPEMIDAIPYAYALATAVHQFDNIAVGDILAKADHAALLVALAAMVPLDRTPEELLAWTRWKREP